MTKFFLVSLSILVVAVLGCAGTNVSNPLADGDAPEQETTCDPGSRGCVCDQGDTCDQGLYCVAGRCVAQPPADGDETDTVDLDPDQEADQEADQESPDLEASCEDGLRTCNGDNSAVLICLDSRWQTLVTCSCGYCEDNACVTSPCDYTFAFCLGRNSAVYTAPDETCCPPQQENCPGNTVCSEEQRRCVDPDQPDGDVEDVEEAEQDEEELSCDDFNPCTEDRLVDGQCDHYPLVCGQDDNPCTVDVCDPGDGQCHPQFVAGGQCDQDDNPCTRHICLQNTMACGPVFESAGVCDQDDNPCTRHQCDLTTLSCLAQADDTGLCADADLCNGQEYCSAGQCTSGQPVTCSTCQACEPATGLCQCVPNACQESCNNLDDDCDDQVDEDSVCDDPSKGIRVELRWKNVGADMDLHFLKGGGVLASNDQTDFNDCTYANPRPDWGWPGLEGDNPRYGSDITSGGLTSWGSPETVHLPIADNLYYRILVHYAGNTTLVKTAQAQVRVYFRGGLNKTLEYEFSASNSYWNVACVSISAWKVTAIVGGDGVTPQVSVGSLSGIDANACNGAGTNCRTLCDCPAGMVCQNGKCATSTTAPLCCQARECPAGEACYSVLDDISGFCGFLLPFNKDTAGNNLSQFANVQTTYLPWGASLSTTRQGAYVATNPYLISGESQGLSCATTDNGSGSHQWEGDVNISLTLPGTTTSAPAVAAYMGFYIADIPVSNGIRVQAFSLDGVEVFGLSVGQNGYVEVASAIPFHRVSISPQRDPNFAIDDVYVPMLMPAP